MPAEPELNGVTMFSKLTQHLVPAAWLLAAGLTGCGNPGALEEEPALEQSQQSLLAGGAVRSGVGANLCLDVSNAGTAPGTNVQIWGCNGTNAQKWTLNSAGELRSGVGTNLCLDVDDANTTPGTNVQIFGCNGTNAQKWLQTPSGELRSALAPNLCLDVANGGTSPGTNVQIAACDGSKARQQWFYNPPVPVSSGSSSVPITFTSVSLNGGGNSLVRVAPGQSIQANIGFSITQDSSCPGCIDQILVGLSSGSFAGNSVSYQVGCIYSGIPSATPTSGTGSVTFNAPTTPGVYYLRFRHGQSYSCDTAWWLVGGAPNEKADFAVITVN
jgi:hypothetical protein